MSAVALASLALSALTAYHLHGHLRDDGAKHKAVLAAVAKTNQPCARRRPDVLDPGVIPPQTRDANL